MSMTRFDRLLWQQAGEGRVLSSLRNAVAASSGMHGEQLTIETIISDEVDPMKALEPPAGARVEHRQGGKVGLLRVDDERGPFLLGCWPTAYAGVCHLVGSIPTTDPRWRKAERWVANAGPAVVPCLLDHRDFSNLGGDLAKLGDVEVSRLTARKRSDLSSLNRGWKARARSLRPSPEQAIAEAESEGASVWSLTLHISDVMSLHLRRLAGATFYNGDFATFDKYVLSGLASAASRRRALLSGRGRQVDTPPGLPISIRLPHSTLIDAEATGEVIAELQKPRNVAVAVMHRNPYLHVVVTDYSDGSNFDVFVTTPDAINIYPGFRASLGALTRLAQQLGERFAALEIVESVPADPVALDELLLAG